MQDDIIPKMRTDDGHELKVGEVFYYRGKGSESAVVYPVIVISINDKIAGLSQVENFEDGYELARQEPSMFVEISRIEVVQMREGLRTRPVKPEIPPLPKQFLKAQKKRRN